jgi:hypothetical protein
VGEGGGGDGEDEVGGGGEEEEMGRMRWVGEGVFPPTQQLVRRTPACLEC